MAGDTGGELRRTRSGVKAHGTCPNSGSIAAIFSSSLSTNASGLRGVSSEVPEWSSPRSSAAAVDDMRTVGGDDSFGSMRRWEAEARLSCRGSLW